MHPIYMYKTRDSWCGACFSLRAIVWKTMLSLVEHEKNHNFYHCFCSYCVFFSLLCICSLFNALHANLYYDDEINEETIRRRCRPDLSCFPSELEWAELEESMMGTLVWPGDKFNYTANNGFFNPMRIT